MSFIFLMSIAFLSFVGSTSANSELYLSPKVRQEALPSQPGFDVSDNVSRSSAKRKIVSKLCRYSMHVNVLDISELVVDLESFDPFGCISAIWTKITWLW